ncbi:MAG TPA: single-stranded-DNA-specific exonuclease RecJ [Verrucomicrobiae bacterium]|nr:single-stranded-DNA-specific exonuclease RecJ [Verrucomicrobiae bacterium]
MDLPLASDLSYSARFLELLKLRGLSRPEEIESFLKAELDALLDPFEMRGMREACDRIRRAAEADEKIFIHGDYDVDGVTGAAIVARTLELLGLRPRVFLPHRAEDGYGVSLRAIQNAAKEGFKILITVDCGITAREQITFARENGMDVIVIDHHKIPAEGVPPAHMILNPLQSDCGYSFKELSAAGLAFKLSQALLGERAFAFLDLAAVSTVCDVAPLRLENRVIVKNGLKLLSSRTHLGFKALAEAAKMGRKEVDAGHIGFVFGPRINAAGRMSSPEISLRLLLTESEKEARSLAAALEEENKCRQREERQTVREAVSDVERTVNFSRDRVIVAAKRGWHQGVIGIVAARLVDKYHRPAVVIAMEENGIGKGSGRSIKQFNLYQALAECKELFEEFGGHPQAAGLSIKNENVDAFRKKINDYARESTAAEIFIRQIEADMELVFGDLTPAFLRELELLEPYGMGNPRPVFMTRGAEVKTAPMGLTPSRFQFYATHGSTVFEVQATEIEESPSSSLLRRLQKGKNIEMAYTVKRKLWDGVERVILEAKEIRLLDEGEGNA